MMSRSACVAVVMVALACTASAVNLRQAGLRRELETVSASGPLARSVLLQVQQRLQARGAVDVIMTHIGTVDTRLVNEQAVLDEHLSNETTLHGTRMTTLNASIADHEREITESTAELATLATQIFNKENQISSLTAQLTGKNGEITGKQGEISAENSRRGAEKAANDKKIEDADAAVAAVAEAVTEAAQSALEGSSGGSEGATGTSGGTSSGSGTDSGSAVLMQLENALGDTPAVNAFVQTAMEAVVGTDDVDQLRQLLTQLKSTLTTIAEEYRTEEANALASHTAFLGNLNAELSTLQTQKTTLETNKGTAEGELTTLKGQRTTQTDRKEDNQRLLGLRKSDRTIEVQRIGNVRTSYTSESKSIADARDVVAAVENILRTKLKMTDHLTSNVATKHAAA